jgi:predicted LPLAT superfamily acyltransferase
MGDLSGAGALPLIWLMVWISAGRSPHRDNFVATGLRHFTCFPRSRAAAGLRPAAGCRPGRAIAATLSVLRHCLLDRVLLLNGRVDCSTYRGEAALTAVREQHGGCFLFGAIGQPRWCRRQPMSDVKTSLVIRDNARKTNAVLNAINPAMAIDIMVSAVRFDAGGEGPSHDGPCGDLRTVRSRASDGWRSRFWRSGALSGRAFRLAAIPDGQWC